jgi:hypothetical protein
MTIFSVFGAAAWWVVVASACWTLKAPAPIVARIASEIEIFMVAPLESVALRA